LENFSFREDNHEKGNGICEKSLAISELLNNPELLSEEREKAKSLRGKLSGSSSISSSKYGGISSDAYYGREMESNSYTSYEKRKEKKKEEPKEEPKEEEESENAKHYEEVKARNKKKNEGSAKKEQKQAVVVLEKPKVIQPTKDLLDLFEMESQSPEKKAEERSITKQKQEHDLLEILSTPSPPKSEPPPKSSPSATVPQCTLLFKFFRGVATSRKANSPSQASPRQANFGLSGLYNRSSPNFV
jgi:hypothetical protein